MTEGRSQWAPTVRVVVVNYNGGDAVVRCFEHLAETDWPPEALELVLVDNASHDGSAERVLERCPRARLVRSPKNLGWSGGNNLVLHDLDGVEPMGATGAYSRPDYVALVNPDAFVEPHWLRPLVEAVQSGERVGAANPRIFLFPRFVALRLRTDTFRPGAGDPRALGVRITGVRHHGRDRWTATLFKDGFFDTEADFSHPHFHWSEAGAELWLPLDEDEDPPAAFELCLDAERDKSVVFESAAGSSTTTVGPRPTWVEVKVGGEPFDVINSVGNELVRGAYGADRGYGDREIERWDEPAEVFSWTGAIVVLDVAYLLDVGLFDDSFFIYSDDFDLSWRGRLRGWRYVYVPVTAGRHVQGGVVSRDSPMTAHYTHRNALLALVKNAPAPVARREVRRYLRDLRAMFRAEVLLPLRRRNRPQPYFTRRRVGVLLAFLAQLPRALVHRRQIGRTATAGRESVLRATED